MNEEVDGEVASTPASPITASPSGRNGSVLDTAEEVLDGISFPTLKNCACASLSTVIEWYYNVLLQLWGLFSSSSNIIYILILQVHNVILIFFSWNNGKNSLPTPVFFSKSKILG